MNALAFCLLGLAAWPALLFLRNLRIFRPPPISRRFADDVSILIPARNEERNIRQCVQAALANSGAEVLVLDDLSDDATARIVREVAAREPRLRLLAGEPLPPGWCGKNWACAQLAAAATRPVLLFVDADVRLGMFAAASLAQWLRQTRMHLGSGIPLQEMHTFPERLLVPLIHFVMLGFLPLHRARRSPRPAYATGCGQLFVADAEAYRRSGGHGAIRHRIHEGLALPQLFRTCHYRTDLLDVTPLATCRMYRTAQEAWRGFGKNTHEGLGKPALILPATAVLLGGQVLPFLLLLADYSLGIFPRGLLLLACAIALTPRVVAALRFRQPLASVWWHPLAVSALLALQWIGLARYLLRRPASWKGRQYPASAGDRVPAADAGKQFPERLKHAFHSSLH